MAPQHLKKPLLKSTVESNNKVTEIVQGVIRDIRANGDKAVRTFSDKFDKWSPASFKLSGSQVQDCIAQVPPQTIKDIKTAQENVRKLAEVQRASIKDVEVEIQPGVFLGHKNNPINRVRSDDEKVDFIAGPGNAFVASPQRLLFGEIGIDLFAGLTEADHGPDTPSVLITTPEKVGLETIKIVDKLLENLPTSELAGTSWRNYGEVILVDNVDEAYKLADEFSSEHVQILTEGPREALKKISNYGALFLGEKTCVSYGDKCIGTNHILPTRKTGNYTGVLWVSKFLKTQTYQEIVDERASGEMGRLYGQVLWEVFKGREL
ncbi:histidinol dehydrogenase-domain-containing protein [Fusarium solani]|uniref:Histidinol dehydrogenase-domain-containing protein n=1 Tax=Fusarium solani TaxID=169388 RepID=A0A9P9GAU3_FUSSL|nr:histidinol dehydrogenase-domain-containing protein [Fusarium solani]KAH7235172.1 histidinol dehydrogenase-domain-containing protein [Fusarium solani]